MNFHIHSYTIQEPHDAVNVDHHEILVILGLRSTECLD